MKKLITAIASITFVCLVGQSNSTPIFDIGSATQTTENALVSVNTRSFDFQSNPIGPITLQGSTVTQATNENRLSNYTPSWLSRAPMSWWHSLHGWNEWVDQGKTSAIPEPATMLLFGGGLACAAIVTRRKMKK